GSALVSVLPGGPAVLLLLATALLAGPVAAAVLLLLDPRTRSLALRLFHRVRSPAAWTGPDPPQAPLPLPPTATADRPRTNVRCHAHPAGTPHHTPALVHLGAGHGARCRRVLHRGGAHRRRVPQRRVDAAGEPRGGR